MKGISSIYLGRHVSKENFRAWVYGPNDAKKLVDSWDEFERDMASGLWFATAEEVQVKDKPKRVRKASEKVLEAVINEMNEQDAIAIKKGVLGEIQDDFLPQASE